MPEQQSQSNVKMDVTVATTGMNMDNSINQIPKGQLSYALNASLENYDNNSVSYQNEPGNELCLNFPDGFQLIGSHFIPEKNKHIFFLTNSQTEMSEIGYMENNDCVYRELVKASCLNFNVKHPILKCVHKITNCTTEIYWTDGWNSRRYLDIENIPYKLDTQSNLCTPVYTNELDCNQLSLQPKFNIPSLQVKEVISGGSLIAGVYQFCVQYSDAQGNPYTSYYSITNPTPIFDLQKITNNFNYEVNKSIILNVSNLDVTGNYQYYNLAVIKTINDISSVELVGTYFIERETKEIIYTGQNKTNVRLTLLDVFEKYPYYDVAQDVTTAQDILIWDQLSSIDRINYQSIANQINLQWQSYKLPATENYSKEVNATNLRGYLRDEVYPFEIVFLLRNGKQTDGFHIPGRAMNFAEISQPDVPNTNPDFIGNPSYIQDNIGYSEYWKIYNTAYVTGPGSGENIGNATPFQQGEFAYWESTETYPCNVAMWGELAGKPIRHHKFPDVLVSPIFESNFISTTTIDNTAIYPLGLKVNLEQIKILISLSALTSAQKNDIVGFKIVRGNRDTNKSIVAKGILRNVGKYNREGTEYYFPNYPYNDLREDPFLLNKSNAFLLETSQQSSSTSGICRNFSADVRTTSIIEYIDCTTNDFVQKTFEPGQYDFCALNLPTVTTGNAYLTCNTYIRYRIDAALINLIGAINYKTLYVDSLSYPQIEYSDNYLRILVTMPFIACSINSNYGSDSYHFKNPPSGYASWTEFCIANPNDGCCTKIKIPWSSPTEFVAGLANTNYRYSIFTFKVVDNKKCTPYPLSAFDEDSKYRQVFNSPETSFGQPYLGSILKLENVIYGGGQAHFTQVKNNAMYRLITVEAQQDAIAASYSIANIGGFNASVFYSAYQAYLQIYINGITRRNYGWSFNSIAKYNSFANIDNNLGIKQRELSISQYLIPGVQGVGDDLNINNWNRESSVYLKTKSELDFPDSITTVPLNIKDESRFTLSSNSLASCFEPQKVIPITSVCYYGSIKNIVLNQYGQIYTYSTVDTGYQHIFNEGLTQNVVFGGDTFICNFAFKTKLPFFTTNRVNAPDDSDVFYDDAGNVAYPKYWHSSRSVLSGAVVGTTSLPNFISTKAHNFDCPNKQTPNSTAVPNPGRTYYDGKMYMFAYGVPNVYCESSYNVDLRQAFNSKEGDFFPHVSTSIPDDWVQETNVPIAQDNTYYYNVSFSKQNKENTFTHLPPDWTNDLCITEFPFRAIYSDPQSQDAGNKVNNWLSYSAISKYDFPQNYGKLVSLDGIQNKAILARFENKTLLYNNLLTIDTSNPQAAYIGNSKLFSAAPPIDFAETDLGYVGSQNKMLLKIPQGQITVDAKRGQIFLLSGQTAQDLSAFGSGMNRFFTDHLAFEILRYFPNVNTDNHLNGIGLHGVYDSKFDRVIITKLDYIPLSSDIKYDETTNTFYILSDVTGVVIKNEIDLTDDEFFCNKSWTISFNMNTKSWTSFHSYIPNWYIGEQNFYYSGLNNSCSSDLELLAGELISTTTTTTSTTSTTTTTTTTTTMAPDCDLEGEATELTCTLDGTAVMQGVFPGIRPKEDLITMEVYYGYTPLDTEIPVFTGASSGSACSAITYFLAHTPDQYNLFSYTVQYLFFEVGSNIYLGTGMDVMTIPDGWYSSWESVNTSTVFLVENGIITQIVSC